MCLVFVVKETSSKLFEVVSNSLKSSSLVYGCGCKLVSTSWIIDGRSRLRAFCSSPSFRIWVQSKPLLFAITWTWNRAFTNKVLRAWKYVTCFMWPAKCIKTRGILFENKFVFVSYTNPILQLKAVLCYIWTTQ